jgi:hypothetical protein
MRYDNNSNRDICCVIVFVARPDGLGEAFIEPQYMLCIIIEVEYQSKLRDLQ